MGRTSDTLGWRPSLLCWWASGPGAMRGLSDVRPFLLLIVLFLLAFSGLGISLWPYAAIFCDAAGGFLVTADTGLCWDRRRRDHFNRARYFSFALWVFRGKINASTGYGG